MSAADPVPRSRSRTILLVCKYSRAMQTTASLFFHLNLEFQCAKMATRTHPRWKQQTRKKLKKKEWARRKKKPTLPRLVPQLFSTAVYLTPTHSKKNEHKINYAVLEIGPLRQTIFLFPAAAGFFSCCCCSWTHLSSKAVRNRPVESDATYEIEWRLLFVLDEEE